jgi:hypothetical protein
MRVEAKIHKCRYCSKEYTYKECRNKVYCCKDCFKKDLSIRRTGKGNPRFNNGRRQYPRLKQDVTACENCGRKYTLDIHHKDGNHKNNVVENLIKVCRRCHMILDGRFKNLNHNNSGTGMCKEVQDNGVQ